MPACPFCTSSIFENAITCPNCGATLAGLQLRASSVLQEKYTLERVLGQGGFGITYLAHDESLNRTVAIKELFPEGSTRHGDTLIPASSLGAHGFSELKTRFLEEARTLAQFNHPGIVRVFEVFEAHGTAYIVMEALQGETLGAQITREQKLSEETVKRIAGDLCAALETIHGAGLLHRDIKPDNVFMTEDSRAVLIDFGSARGFVQGQAKRHTQLVTPGYAAPEQYATEAKFGAYTDIYGLSATLYHAVTGKPPPTSSDRVISSDSELHVPESVGEPLRTALKKGLQLRIDERPQSAQAFSRLLIRTDSNLGRLPAQSAKAIHPSMQREQVLLQTERLLITTKKMQFLRRDKNGDHAVTYAMPDIENVFCTNNAWKATPNNEQPSWANVIFISIFSTISLIFTILFIQTLFFVFLLTLCVSGIAFLVAQYNLLKKFNRKDIWYVFAITKPIPALLGMTIEHLKIVSTTNEAEAKNLAIQIHTCLEP